MKNAVLFEKGTRQLAGALALLNGKTASTVDANTLEEVATLSLVATRLLLRLAGRIDVPRPDPVVVVKKRPKPVASISHKSPEASARMPKPQRPNVDVVFDVSMTMDQGNDLLGGDSKVKHEKKSDRAKRHAKEHETIARVATGSAPKRKKKKGMQRV
jgi:hypothetical protein